MVLLQLLVDVAGYRNVETKVGKIRAKKMGNDAGNEIYLSNRNIKNSMIIDAMIAINEGKKNTETSAAHSPHTAHTPILMSVLAEIFASGYKAYKFG